MLLSLRYAVQDHLSKQLYSIFFFRKFLQLQKSILWEVNHMAHAVSIFSGSWHQRLEVWECSLNKKRAHIQQRGARENNHTKPRLRNIRYLLSIFVIFFRFISSWQRRLSWKHVRFSFGLPRMTAVTRRRRRLWTASALRISSARNSWQTLGILNLYSIDKIDKKVLELMNSRDQIISHQRRDLVKRDLIIRRMKDHLILNEGVGDCSDNCGQCEMCEIILGYTV